MKKIVQIIIVSQIGDRQENEPPILINPQLTMSVLSVPTTFSFGVTIITTGYNFSEINNFAINILNLDAKDVAKHRLAFHNKFDKNSYKQASDGDKANATFNIELNNFVFRNEGTYRVEVSLDDEKFTQEFNIRVENEVE